MADDDPLATAYIAQLLAPATALRLVGRATTLNELQTSLATEKPDVLVCETQLAGRSTFATLAALPSGPEASQILVLTADQSEASVLAAAAAGIRCYWLKEHAFEGLPDLIRRCAAGEAVLDDQLVGIVLKGYHELAHGLAGATPVRQLGMSHRAEQVLQLMALGLPNREIGRRLGLSEHTVKIYVGQLFRHLGVSDRTAAVMEAMRRGLVRPAV